MFTAFHFLHILGAIVAGFYILMPLFVSKVNRLTPALREGYLRNLIQWSRIGQYVLIAQFITGGYLISQKPYSVLWIVLVIVIFLIVGGLAGMMGRPLRKYRDALMNQDGKLEFPSKITLYSVLITIGFIALVVLMYSPMYR